MDPKETEGAEFDRTVQSLFDPAGAPDDEEDEADGESEEEGDSGT